VWAYRHRRSELREELEGAKRGNAERAEQAEQEIDALTSELSRAVDSCGRLPNESRNLELCPDGAPSAPPSTRDAHRLT
jgi:hypothetical protein